AVANSSAVGDRLTAPTGVTHSRAPRTSTATTLIREIRANARHLLLWQGRGLVHTLRSGGRPPIRNRSEWNDYNEDFPAGGYDGPIQRVLDAGAAEPWVLDVGGHAGFFALRFADLWLRAHADRPFHLVSVEGSPTTAVHLSEHLSQAVL